MIFYNPIFKKSILVQFLFIRKMMLTNYLKKDFYKFIYKRIFWFKMIFFTTSIFKPIFLTTFIYKIISKFKFYLRKLVLQLYF